jgi:hypothetical protein
LASVILTDVTCIVLDLGGWNQQVVASESCHETQSKPDDSRIEVSDH